MARATTRPQDALAELSRLAGKASPRRPRSRSSPELSDPRKRTVARGARSSRCAGPEMASELAPDAPE
eukprot:6208843-Alexandrium_andersonii.AAC.1